MGSLNNIQLDLDKLPNLAVDRNKLRSLAPAAIEQRTVQEGPKPWPELLSVARRDISPISIWADEGGCNVSVSNQRKSLQPGYHSPASWRDEAERQALSFAATQRTGRLKHSP